MAYPAEVTIWELLQGRLSVVRQGDDVQDTHVLFR